MGTPTQETRERRTPERGRARATTRLLVVTSIAAGNFGRTVPDLVIADHLKRRGHSLRFVVGGEGDFSSSLRELGFDVLVRAYAGRARTVWKRAALRLGTAALARRYADVDAVVGFRLSSTLLALGVGRRLGVPVMSYLHGHTDRAEKYEKHGIHRADMVLAVSQEALDCYARASVGLRSPEQELVQVLNGIDYEGFRAMAGRMDARAEFGIPTDVELVGMAGTTLRKGTDVFVKAAARIAAERPEAHFLVAGEFASEELRREVHDIVERSGLTARMHWVGFQENIGAVMQGCDVWAMPSRNDAFPLVGLETMSAGTPMVASAVGGVPEMVLDGETGFLVPSADVERLADRLLALLCDGDLRASMGERGKAFVQEKLSLDRQVDEFERCLQNLIRRGPLRQPAER